MSYVICVSPGSLTRIFAHTASRLARQPRARPADGRDAAKPATRPGCRGPVSRVSSASPSRIRSFGAKEDHPGMECPHCGSDFDTTPHTFALGIDQDGTWQVSNTRCPTCDRLIVAVCSDDGKNYPALPAGRASGPSSAKTSRPNWPPSTGRPARCSSTARKRRRRSPAGCCSGCWPHKPAPATAAWPTRYSAPSPRPAMPDYLKEALETLAKVAKLESHEPRATAATPSPGERGRSRVVARGAQAALRVLLRPAGPRCAACATPSRSRLAPAPVDRPPESSEEAEGDADDWTVVRDEPAAEAAPAKEPVREPVK